MFLVLAPHPAAFFLFFPEKKKKKKKIQRLFFSRLRALRADDVVRSKPAAAAVRRLLCSVLHRCCRCTLRSSRASSSPKPYVCGSSLRIAWSVRDGALVRHGLSSLEETRQANERSSLTAALWKEGAGGEPGFYCVIVFATARVGRPVGRSSPARPARLGNPLALLPFCFDTGSRRCFASLIRGCPCVFVTRRWRERERGRSTRLFCKERVRFLHARGVFLTRSSPQPL